jgi:anti-sigma factor RsiW
MKTMTCESVRDLLPELAAATLDTGSRAAVEVHLARCAECAAEQALVAAIRAAAPEPPAGLGARINLALDRPATVPPRATWARPVAIAATAAFALLTGGLLIRSQQRTTDVADADVVAAVPVGWPAVQAAPMLRVAPTLHDLSMEELESLLAELDS